MHRQLYDRPSVHEVAIGVIFANSSGLDAIENAPTLLQGEEPGFGRAQRIEQNRVDLVSGFGPVEAHASAEFLGWAFQTDNWPRWLVRAWQDRLALNMMRSEGWPSGDYIGWERIRERFAAVHGRLGTIYSTLTPRRVGLRYLNRFSLPAGEPFANWLCLSMQSPSSLRNPKALRLRCTWDEIERHAGLSATITLANVPVPANPSDEIGVLLDIDIFGTEDLPTYEQIPTWLDAAHSAENLVFESCITDGLRNRFEVSR